MRGVGKVKRIAYLVIPWASFLILFTMFDSVVKAGPAGPTDRDPYTQRICDIPSLSNGTIQSGVDDPQCRVLNLSASVFQENVLITRSVTIHGQGAASTTVDGGLSGGVFTIVAPGGAVTLTQMAIVNGLAPSGGGVSFYGDALVIEEVLFSGNDAVGGPPDGRGGGLYVNAGGSVTITNSTFV